MSILQCLTVNVIGRLTSAAILDSSVAILDSSVGILHSSVAILDSSVAVRLWNLPMNNHLAPSCSKV